MTLYITAYNYPIYRDALPLTPQQHTAPTYQLNGMPATQLTDGHIYITNNRKIIKQ